MIELENSENLKDRIKYHAFLKEVLARSIQFAKQETDPHLKELEEKYVEALKIRIAKYDIYRQKVDTSCKVCKEVDCVCYVLKEPIKESGEITEQELNKLF